jgi:hypothetical protein
VALSIQQIQRILNQRGSPMARELPAIARVAQQEGVPLGYVLGIAGKESEFGKTGYARGRHNPYGYGIYSDLDWPSYAETTRNMLRGIKSGTYKGAQTPRSIAEIYAPSSDGNNPAGYAQDVGRIAKMFGYDIGPNTDVIGANVGAVQPGDVPGNTGRGDSSTGLGASISKAQLLAAVMGMQSKDPMTRFSSLLTVRDAKQGGGVQNNIGTMPDQAPATSADVDLSKYPTSGVDQAGRVQGGAGGNWGGSQSLAYALARASGLPITSTKRTRQKTASGGISDHWIGSKLSYAVDLGTSGSAGDRAWRRVTRYLEGLQPGNQGIGGASSGAWRNWTIGGHRYNVGWEVPGHYDHIHAGVRRIG